MRRQIRFSGRTPVLILTGIVMLSVSLFPLTAQAADRKAPSWILCERGKAAFGENDFGGALRYFEQAVKAETLYPEAEYWIGRIYEEEGEYYLAEQQYLKALEMSRVLYIPDDKYEITYRLADLYKNQGKYGDYEELLLKLFNGEFSQDAAKIRLENSYVTVLTDDGLNKLIYLYRLELNYSLRAVSELGVYYYKTGDYRGSLIKDLYAVISVFSYGIGYLIKKDIDFEFPDTEEKLIELDEEYYFDSLNHKEKRFNGVSYCLDKFNHYQEIVEYLKITDFYRSFYYLGAALYAEGYADAAAEIWDYIRLRPEAGIWGKKAADQYVHPRIETNELIF